MDTSNLSKYNRFRLEYPYISFENYYYNVEENEIDILFSFNLAGKYFFKPSARLLLPPRYIQQREKGLTEGHLQNLVFHIGMIELISYWKTACPKEIRIIPHKLLPAQVDWWKALYYNGMGEFFHVNGIKPDYKDFVDIIVTGEKELKPFSFETVPGKMVPVGGGKDSAVTLQLLKDEGYEIIPFAINPRPAIERTIEAAGLNDGQDVIVERKLDPLMLEMNEKGFLNGHTPFSALLAFYALLGSYVSGRADIALSNESSANEPTIPGTGINHQYSKSYHFEKTFRHYISENISSTFNYHSFLRPLNELQIGKIFSGMKKYHGLFRSCNAGSKEDKWCGACSKCLFTWVILAPFLDDAELEKIFGKDMASDGELAPLLDQLTGHAEEKPFECVGTIDEVNAAMGKIAAMEKTKDKPLLSHYRDWVNRPDHSDEMFWQKLKFSPEKNPHFLDHEEQEVLKKALRNA